MSNIKIFICAHKEVKLPKHPYFLPIQAGAALHKPIMSYQPDSEGDNISIKNPHFCELTCHYWAWKNLKNVEIVGLNHYRRYFDFTRKWSQFSADKHFIPTEEFLKTDYTQQYGDYHIARDWEMLRSIIKERSPQYIPAFEKTMDHSNKAAGYNMFITHWKHFDAYSEWLFDILFEVERRVPPIDDPVQSRIYGYMSERLINVFCEHYHLRIKHIPLIMPLDDAHKGLNINNWHALCRRFVNDLYYLKNK